MAATPAALASASPSAARFISEAVALRMSPAAPTSAIATTAWRSAARRAITAPRRSERSLASM